MTKTARYIILCEDRQTQCLIFDFLKVQNINRRKIRCYPLPADTDSGCGEAYVRQHYPEELQYLRSKNYNDVILFVCIDADSETFKHRYEQLEEACRKPGIPVRTGEDAVAYFIPKRNIETWIQWYTDKSANETDTYPHKRGHEADCKEQAGKMAEDFNSGVFEAGELQSITAAKKEYEKLP